MFNMLRFKSCFIWNTYFDKLDESLRVLQLVTHLPNVTKNG